MSRTPEQLREFMANHQFFSPEYNLAEHELHQLRLTDLNDPFPNHTQEFDSTPERGCFVKPEFETPTSQKHQRYVNIGPSCRKLINLP